MTSEAGSQHGTTASVDVLARRAQLLARPVQAGPVEPSVEMLVVAAGGRLLGLDLRRIREVLPPAPVCPLPRRGGHSLSGVRSVRGELVVVADAGPLVGLDAARSPEAGWVLIVEAQDPIGLLVDEPGQVAAMSLSQPWLEPTHGRTRLHPALSAVTADGLLVVDIDQLLADARLRVQGAARMNPLEGGT